MCRLLSTRTLMLDIYAVHAARQSDKQIGGFKQHGGGHHRFYQKMNRQAHRDNKEHSAGRCSKNEIRPVAFQLSRWSRKIWLLKIVKSRVTLCLIITCSLILRTSKKCVLNFCLGAGCCQDLIYATLCQSLFLTELLGTLPADLVCKRG